MKDDICLDTLRKGTPYWYTGSPYSKTFNRVVSFMQVCEATAWLLKNGVEAYSPIAHSHSVAQLGSIDPVDQQFWLDRCKPFMETACGMIVVMLDGWRISDGVNFEIHQFKLMGKPVRFMQWPRPEKSSD